MCRKGELLMLQQNAETHTRRHGIGRRMAHTTGCNNTGREGALCGRQAQGEN